MNNRFFHYALHCACITSFVCMVNAQLPAPQTISEIQTIITTLPADYDGLLLGLKTLVEQTNYIGETTTPLSTGMLTSEIKNLFTNKVKAFAAAKPSYTDGANLPKLLDAWNVMSVIINHPLFNFYGIEDLQALVNTVAACTIYNIATKTGMIDQLNGLNEFLALYVEEPRMTVVFDGVRDTCTQIIAGLYDKRDPGQLDALKSFLIKIQDQKYASVFNGAAYPALQNHIAALSTEMTSGQAVSSAAPAAPQVSDSAVAKKPPQAIVSASSKKQMTRAERMKILTAPGTKVRRPEKRKASSAGYSAGSRRQVATTRKTTRATK